MISKTIGVRGTLFSDKPMSFLGRWPGKMGDFLRPSRMAFQQNQPFLGWIGKPWENQNWKSHGKVIHHLLRWVWNLVPGIPIANFFVEAVKCDMDQTLSGWAGVGRTTLGGPAGITTQKAFTTDQLRMCHDLIRQNWTSLNIIYLKIQHHSTSFT